MRLYEFEAKGLFRRSKIPVPDGVVIDRANLSDTSKVVFPVVIKAQVFLGKRGKAGYIQHAQNMKELHEKILGMLGKKHGPYVIEKVLVERRLYIAREFYVAATIDRLEHKPVLIISQEGGIDIEEVAAKKPKSIVKHYFNPGQKISPFQARNIANGLGLHGPGLGACAEIVQKLCELFLQYDCKLVEINPLVVTEKNDLFALDAKVDLDEDAMFRHPEFRELGIVARHEVGELTDREKLAKASGIPYVDLDGDIGVFPGGAGFGIAALDLIEHYGGKPANFMDSGGAPTQEKLRTMLGLLMDNPKVKAIFGARFGGISRCDDWAHAVVRYILENKPHKPMIMRMAGNMEEEGRAIIEQAKKKNRGLFKNIKIYAYDTPIEEVIKETVRIARTSNSKK